MLCFGFQRDDSPGNCWALHGSQGYVVVKLSKVICPAVVALDHISKTDSLTEEITSAPKNFAIYVSYFLTFYSKTNLC